MHRILTLLTVAVLFPISANSKEAAPEAEQVLALAGLTAAPETFPAEGFEVADGITPIFYQALPYERKPTRVFAWLGLPEDSSSGAPVPGIVLVHGGGGTAFREWVARWNARGYAAISIAVEGQTDVRKEGSEDSPWEQHAHPGPSRSGIYGDSDRPLAEQWMFHAVADTILANSLLRSLPEVEPERVGIMGVSWGGVITSTVIGIDTRFAFAIPTYGCGGLADAPNQYGRSLGENVLYREVWDPVLRLGRATMPTLWFSWTGDQHFPLDCQADSYRAAAGSHMVSLIPGMGHGHGPAWEPEDSYAFADSVILDGGRPWCQQTGIKVEDDSVRVRFASSKPIDSAVLSFSKDTGASGERSWSDSPATVRVRDGAIVVEASLPEGITGWFFLLKSGPLYACSDYYDYEGDPAGR